LRRCGRIVNDADRLLNDIDRLGSTDELDFGQRGATVHAGEKIPRAGHPNTTPASGAAWTDEGVGRQFGSK